MNTDFLYARSSLRLQIAHQVLSDFSRRLTQIQVVAYADFLRVARELSLFICVNLWQKPHGKIASKKSRMIRTSRVFPLSVRIHFDDYADFYERKVSHLCSSV
jgi:hypothetical protein